MAKVYVGSASIDENGRAQGGRAGDQTGRELKKQAWYLHKKGWRVFRCRDERAAARIASAMRAAIANRHIGYDQAQRDTLYRQAKAVGFDPGKVAKDCETDCSALVRVCCAYAGITGLPAGFRTANMAKHLLATGRFDELTDSKYRTGGDWLAEGDILVTKTSGHTVVALNDGPRHRRGGQAAVTIAGGNCYVRDLPGPDGRKLGVAKRGAVLPYAGQTDAATGWHRVAWNGGEGWVSGRYGRLG